MFDASNPHGLKMKFSDLKALLKDSYDTRSKFVHTLKEINKELFIPEIRKADALLYGMVTVLNQNYLFLQWRR